MRAAFATVSFGRLTILGDTMPWLHVLGHRRTARTFALSTTPRHRRRRGRFGIGRYSRRIYLLPFGVTIGARRRRRRPLPRGHARAGARPRLRLGHARRQVCGAECGVLEAGEPHDAMATTSGDFSPFERALAG